VSEWVGLEFNATPDTISFWRRKAGRQRRRQRDVYSTVVLRTGIKQWPGKLRCPLLKGRIITAQVTWRLDLVAYLNTYPQTSSLRINHIPSARVVLQITDDPRRTSRRRDSQTHIHTHTHMDLKSKARVWVVQKVSSVPNNRQSVFKSFYKSRFSSQIWVQKKH